MSDKVTLLSGMQLNLYGSSVKAKRCQKQLEPQTRFGKTITGLIKPKIPSSSAVP